MTSGPWWYSGDEAADLASEESAASEQPAAPEQSPGQSPGQSLDWSALAVGAQRLVEWATERVVAPHAEHEDPRQHPECVMCRALALMADRPATASTTGSAATPDPIVWIPIMGEDAAPEA